VKKCEGAGMGAGIGERKSSYNKGFLRSDKELTVVNLSPIGNV